MKLKLKFPLIILSIIIYSCTPKAQPLGGQATETTDDARMEDISSMSPGARLNKFAFNIYKEILQNTDDNLVISPFSISTAMAMAYGASGGETKDQMSRTLLFYPGMEKFHEEFAGHSNMIKQQAGDNIELNIANSLWLQDDYPFKESFFETIKNHYGPVLYETDFKTDHEAAREQINDWVSDQTNQKIEELIREGVLIEDTRLVLVNAIYFLSNWLQEFDKELTHERDFFIDDQNKVKTKFMKKESRFKYYKDQDVQVLEIPYAGKNFSMLLILPSKDTGISTFETKFNSSLYSNYIDNLKHKKVELLMPKFKMRFNVDLENILKQLGMPLAFSDYADLSRLTDRDDLKFDKVIHQAFIEVDEEGTEAAAATAVTVIVKTAMPDDEKIVFKADRPFHFLIKENDNNTILFMGKVNDPVN